MRLSLKWPQPIRTGRQQAHDGMMNTADGIRYLASGGKDIGVGLTRIGLSGFGRASSFGLKQIGKSKLASGTLIAAMIPAGFLASDAVFKDGQLAKDLRGAINTTMVQNCAKGLDLVTPGICSTAVDKYMLAKNEPSRG